MRQRPSLTISNMPKQPAAGFTAVNGRSPPSWTDHPRPSSTHTAQMDRYMFGNARPSHSSHYSGDHDEGRKRKRDETDSGSPHSNSSSRRRLSPPPSQTQPESLPPIANGQPNGVPYTTQEPNAQMPRPTYSGPNENGHWQPHRPSMDDGSTETRLMEAFNRDDQQPHPNGNHAMPPSNGHPSHSHYPPVSVPDDQHHDQDQQSPSQTLPGMSAPNMQKQRKRYVQALLPILEYS